MVSTEAHGFADRALNRVQQGLRGLFAFALHLDLDLAARTLTPQQLALFQQMTRGEQLHSLNVLRDVQAQGATPSDLAVAALMHDVGKSRYPMRVWQKTLVVLVRELAEPIYLKITRSSERNWFARPFIVGERHAKWGADLLRDIGANERIVWLVAHHDKNPEKLRDHPDHALLLRLQQADAAN
jgi:hypothetical protein